MKIPSKSLKFFRNFFIFLKILYNAVLPVNTTKPLLSYGI